MYQFREISSMTEEELKEELRVTCAQVDRLALLGASLHTAYDSGNALIAVFANQKGHEIFLIALTTVVQTCERLAVSCAKRLTTTLDYEIAISEKLGVPIDVYQEWPTYQELMDLAWSDKRDSSI